MKFKKVSNIIIKEFNSKPMYNEKYLKTKMTCYNGKTNTNIHNNKTQKEGSQCIFLSVILTASVYRKDKDYYPQLFLEEWKYVAKEKNMLKFITDAIETSDDDSDRPNSIEEILMKKITYNNFLTMNFLNIGARKFHFLKCKKCFQVDILIF